MPVSVMREQSEEGMGAGTFYRDERDPENFYFVAGSEMGNVYMYIFCILKN